MVPLDSRGVNFSLEDSFTKHDKRPGNNDVIGHSPFLPDVIATYRTPGRGTTVDNVRLFQRNVLGSKLEGLRVIAVGEVFIQFINHSIVLQFQGAFQKYLSPHQFGILTPEGQETIIFGIRVFLNRHLDWVMMQVDVKNVFNNVSNSRSGHYTHKVTGRRPFDDNKNRAQ